MVVVTSSTVVGKEIKKTFGIVRGNTIRARHHGENTLAVFKNMFGLEIQKYIKLLDESRDQSIDRMIENAKELGANAVVDCRFSTSYIMADVAEIMVYGTAVYVE